jgi:DnaJ-class molecular chaperone
MRKAGARLVRYKVIRVNEKLCMACIGLGINQKQELCRKCHGRGRV